MDFELAISQKEVKTPHEYYMSTIRAGLNNIEPLGFTNVLDEYNNLTVPTKGI